MEIEFCKLKQTVNQDIPKTHYGNALLFLDSCYIAIGYNVSLDKFVYSDYIDSQWYHIEDAISVLKILVANFLDQRCELSNNNENKQFILSNLDNVLSTIEFIKQILICDSLELEKVTDD